MEKNANQEFLSAVGQLKSSPIFAMSLGSKELFHSNFWAWIGDHHPQFITTFFPSISLESVNHPVQREQGNRDITIWAENWTKAFVIENKLKSMPCLDQLKKYEKNLEDRFAGGVLTGINKPTFDLPEKWQFVSYDQICKRVLNLAESVSSNIHKTILLEYAQVLKSMFQVISAFDECLSWNFPLDGFTGMENELKEIKLWDICQKIQAGKFLDYSKSLFGDEFLLKIKSIEKLGFKFESYMGFTRANVYIDFGFIRDYKENTECAMGIQIQGGRYERYVKIRSATLTPNDIFEKFKKLGWFVEKSLIPNTVMRNSFCSYEEKAELPYRFVYQYETITDPSFEGLGRRIASDFDRIVELIEINQL